METSPSTAALFVLSADGRFKLQRKSPACHLADLYRLEPDGSCHLLLSCVNEQSAINRGFTAADFAAVTVQPQPEPAMSEDAKIFAAAVYGTAASKRGAKCVPAHDARLMQLLVENEVGEGKPVLDAWAKAWHDANLAAVQPQPAPEQPDPVLEETLANIAAAPAEREVAMLGALVDMLVAHAHHGPRMLEALVGHSPSFLALRNEAAMYASAQDPEPEPGIATGEGAGTDKVVFTRDDTGETIGVLTANFEAFERDVARNGIGAISEWPILWYEGVSTVHLREHGQLIIDDAYFYQGNVSYRKLLPKHRTIAGDWDKGAHISRESIPVDEFEKWQEAARGADHWVGTEFTLGDFQRYIAALAAFLV